MSGLRSLTQAVESARRGGQRRLDRRATVRRRKEAVVPASWRTSRSVGRVCALLILALLAVGPLFDPPLRISASALAARQSDAGVVGYRGDAARTGIQPG